VWLGLVWRKSNQFEKWCDKDMLLPHQFFRVSFVFFFSRHPPLIKFQNLYGKDMLLPHQFFFTVFVFNDFSRSVILE